MTRCQDVKIDVHKKQMSIFFLLFFGSSENLSHINHPSRCCLIFQTMGDTQPPKSLEEDCGWVSSAFMLYLDRLFAKGNVKSLETADLGHISERDRTDGLHKNFVVHFEEFKKNLKPDQALTSLWTPLMKTVSLFMTSADMKYLTI